MLPRISTGGYVRLSPFINQRLLVRSLLIPALNSARITFSVPDCPAPSGKVLSAREVLMSTKTETTTTETTTTICARVSSSCSMTGSSSIINITNPDELSRPLIVAYGEIPKSTRVTSGSREKHYSGESCDPESGGMPPPQSSNGAVASPASDANGSVTSGSQDVRDMDSISFQPRRYAEVPKGGDKRSIAMNSLRSELDRLRPLVPSSIDSTEMDSISVWPKRYAEVPKGGDRPNRPPFVTVSYYPPKHQEESIAGIKIWQPYTNLCKDKGTRGC